MPTLRHEEVREQLLAGLSDSGRRQLEAFGSVYEARQVAARLAELRAQAQLSQRQVARRAGMDQADLSRIESAQIMPSLPTLLRLLDAVGGSLVLTRTTVPTFSQVTKAARRSGTSATKRVAVRKAVAKPLLVGKAAAGRGPRPAKLAAAKAGTRKASRSPAVPARAGSAKAEPAGLAKVPTRA